MCICRGGYRISEKGGLLMNNKMGGGAVRFRPIQRAGGGGGGGGGAVRFQPIQRAGGGVLSAHNCMRK